MRDLAPQGYSILVARQLPLSYSLQFIPASVGDRFKGGNFSKEKTPAFPARVSTARSFITLHATIEIMTRSLMMPTKSYFSNASANESEA
jgi:hypothetical protein